LPPEFQVRFLLARVGQPLTSLTASKTKPDDAPRRNRSRAPQDPSRLHPKALAWSFSPRHGRRTCFRSRIRQRDRGDL